uniref:Uncharacterized protein n=1 Tax=Oryza brachyantha TaxID=4533 RepID=J3M9B5_ORYBR
MKIVFSQMKYFEIDEVSLLMRTVLEIVVQFLTHHNRLVLVEYEFTQASYNMVFTHCFYYCLVHILCISLLFAQLYAIHETRFIISGNNYIHSMMIQKNGDSNGAERMAVIL